jgi:hypothetical protein
MKYKNYSDVVNAAQASGSSAATFAGASRWILGHVKPASLDVHPDPWATKCRNTRKQYARKAWFARIEARLDCVAKSLGIWSLVDAEALAASLTKPYLDRATSAIESHWPYRRSQSSWAGGNHSVIVTLGVPSARCESAKVWSDNGKWSGTNSSAVITTDLETLAHFPTLMTADGLALCHAEQIGRREYKVSWIEQSTGMSLKTVSGYLIRGYHCKATSPEQARNKATKARRQQLAALLAKRQTQTKTNMKHVYVDFSDSIAAGNCRPATEQAAQTIWQLLGAVGPCAVRADVLVSFRNDSYAQKAIGAAIRRTLSL